MPRIRGVAGARTQRALHQGQGQAFRFQRLRRALAQAMPEQRHQRLGARIDARALMPERQRPAVAQQSLGRQFAQQGFVDVRASARHRRPPPDG